MRERTTSCAARLTATMGLALATSLWLGGCGDAGGHGHEHDEHGHSHDGDDQDHDHDHGHEGHEHNPHYGGILIELGEEFANVEVRLDADSGILKAWIWDGCAEDPIRISQTELRFDIEKEGGAKVSLTLGAVASELTGETVGDTSVFEGKSAELEGLGHFAATLSSIEVKGQKLDPVKFDYEHDHE